MRLALVVCIGLWVSVAASEPGTVVLRGGAEFEASSIEADAGALTCTIDGDQRIFGWQEVAEVRGPMADEVRPYLPTAESAWRGLARLARGDRVAAEPVLESVFDDLSGQISPTALAVSQGLLACRLARGAQALSVEPMLTEIANDSATVEIPTVKGASPLDPEFGLCPALPPIWGTDSGLSAMVGAISRDKFGVWIHETKAEQLAKLYATAALFELGSPAPAPTLTPVDAGVKFMQEIVLARVGDAKQRLMARSALTDRLNAEDLPGWQSAWIHSSLGLSLIRESDEHETRLGIVELLYVPAIYAQTEPYLAGVCLSEAAIKLAELGREDAARSLATELARNFALHPSLERPGIRRLVGLAREHRTSTPPKKEGS